MPLIQPVKGAPEVFVRIRPYNPQKKRLKRQYATFFGFTFKEEAGWNRVPSKIIHAKQEFDVENYLRTIRQDENDEDSERVFDVCTKAEAQAIDKREKAEIAKKNTADNADLIGGVNNPRDMTRNMTRAESDEEATPEAPPLQVKRGRGRPKKAAPSASAE